MNKKQLITTAVAGVVALGLGLSTQASAQTKPAEAKGTCTEKNACKGHGSCKSSKHDCKGKNTCASNTVVDVTKKQCDDMKGEWKANG